MSTGTFHRDIAVTLADTEGMPYIVARCNLSGWNGWHVPRVSGETVRAYFDACAAYDPNGSWGSVIVTVSEHGFIVHNCESASCGPDDDGDMQHDHDEDDVILTDDDGTVSLDGWCWQTARDALTGESILIADDVVAPNAGTIVRP